MPRRKMKNIVIMIVAALAGALIVAVSSSCARPESPEVPARLTGAPQVAAPALLATPAVLPATARLAGVLTDVKQCRDAAGAVLQQVTDPDVEDNAAGDLFVGAIHWKQTIAISTSTDGVKWAPMRPVVNAQTFGAWSAHGCETPSLKRPSGTEARWTLLVSGYPSCPGLPTTGPVGTTRGRIKSIYLATAPDVSGLPGVFTAAQQGPVIGTQHSWATPYVKTGGYIDAGMDEPAHVIIGQWWFALVSGTSYAQGQAPQLGFAYAPASYNGRSWLVEPDPVVPSAAGLYVTQADLVIDKRDGSYHAFVTRAYSAAQSDEGIHRLWSTDLRNWVEPDPKPIVRTQAGTSRAGRCFGSTAVMRQKPTGEWYFRLWWSEVPTVSAIQTGPWTMATGVIDA